ncbi:hypothetical protein OG21DRAFT_1492252 [Imleria badia]|nr:hypothetical protein OG21DRAFT_1492252 [Imleria badia]
MALIVHSPLSQVAHDLRLQHVLCTQHIWIFAVPSLVFWFARLSMVYVVCPEYSWQPSRHAQLPRSPATVPCSASESTLT